MKTKSKNIAYSKWSESWQEARETIGNIKLVLELWNNIPSNWRRSTLEGGPGFRNKHAPGGVDKGEVIIERQFFDQYLHELKFQGNSYPIVAAYHKMPLANQKQGQRTADAVGLLLARRSIHPVLIEVKVDANNCWYALVENLQQVRMARANPQLLKSWSKQNKLPDASGAWGMVLAPRAYYDRDRKKGTLTHCVKLLKALDVTNARIAFALSDRLENHRIDVTHSNWSLG